MATIVQLYKNYKPFGFFTLFAGILTVVAAAMFIPVFAEFLKIGLVNHFPTLIVSCFVELAALQAFFSGMILSDIAKKNRRDFEFQLNQVHRQKKENRL